MDIGAEGIDGGEVCFALLLQLSDAVEGITKGGACPLFPSLEKGAVGFTINDDRASVPVVGDVGGSERLLTEVNNVCEPSLLAAASKLHIDFIVMQQLSH